MKSTLFAALGTAALLFAAAPVSAVVIAQMDGDHNVVNGNTGTDPGTAGLGNTVTLYPDNAAGWSSALASASPVLLVEQRAEDFAPIAGVTSFITGGGRLIVLGGSSAVFMNAIFGTSMVEGSFGADLEPFTKTAAAAGTTFAGDAATLLGLSSHHEIVSGALPAASTVFYQGAGDPMVFRTTLGTGDMFFIGWDYCCGGSQADHDAWYGVLDSAINFATVPVPEPSTLALLGLGIVGLGIARRKRAA